jgi:uncharacterized protein (TIGR02145 family)
MKYTIRFLLLTASLMLTRGLIHSCGGAEDDKGNDIKDYKTVVIGTQTWMAENLNYNVKGSKCYGEGGIVIKRLDEDNPTTKTLSPTEVQAICAKYGRLYDWSTAMGLPWYSCNKSDCSSRIKSRHRGICPSGWHIPSNDDWKVLEDYIGNDAGTKLKATSDWNEGGNGTDKYKFSALPGGLSVLGGFGNAGYGGYWWSTSEDNSDSTYFRAMSNSNEYVGRGSTSKSFKLSVRCVRD